MQMVMLGYEQLCMPNLTDLSSLNADPDHNDVAGVAFGAKTQALTQFPRCCLNSSLPEWKFNDCDDVDRLAQ